MNLIVSPTRPSSTTWSHFYWMACVLVTLFFHTVAFASNSPGYANPQGKQILFVVDNIPDYQHLTSVDTANMEVVVLDSQQDGLRQIAAALEGRRAIAGLHLASHGGPAMLGLGSLMLGSAQLAGRAADLGVIRTALRHDANIFLYGCNVAQGDAGQRFIGALAHATGANVAASTNLTGARALGGDWMLESRTGAVRNAALAFPAYRAVLPTVAGTVAIPFGHPDTAIATAKMVDG